MRRSVFIALVAGVLAGLGVQLALAQPVDPLNAKFRNATVTNSVAIGNDLTVGDDLTVTDVAKVAVLDAGVALINGQLQTLGPAISSVGTGVNGYACATNGCRIDLGAGANDYVYSDGTYINTPGRLVASDAVMSTNQFVSAGSYLSSGNASGAALFIRGAVMAIGATAPTVTACSGGTPASVTWSNGTAAFVFDVGTSCAGESTAVITLPATTTGWVCHCSTTTADKILQQKVMPASTTQVTMQNITISTGANGDFADGADAACLCMGG